MILRLLPTIINKIKEERGMKFHRMVLNNKQTEVKKIFCNENIVVEQYNEKYHQIIPQIYAKSFNELPWPKDWDQFNGRIYEGIFVAIDKATNHCVGFIVSYFRDGYGYISVVAVVPEYRRQGIAMLLINQAISFLNAKEKLEIKIDVETSNEQAIILYQKIGFLIKETKED